MGLGSSAFTVASHVTIVAAVLLAFARLQQLRADGSARHLFVSHWAPPLAAHVVVAALVVERLYYVAARLLRSHGVDLWQAHPAPAALSVLLAASIWSVSVAKSLSVLTPRWALRVALVELFGLAGLWAVLVATLQ